MTKSTALVPLDAISPATSAPSETPSRIPAPGEYWRIARGFARNKVKSLRRGTVLLVTDCRYLDGSLHSVRFASHPAEHADKDTFTLTLPDFLAHFTFEPHGDVIRLNEIAAIQQRARDEQEALSRGPTAEDLGVTPDEARPHAAPPGKLSLSDLAIPERRKGIELAIKTQLALAKAQSTWLVARSEAINAAAATLAAFYGERSQAALAAVSGLNSQVKSLTEGTKTLSLYLGTGVEVSAIATGQSAPSTERLTLFQAMRYMDEEYAVHLAGGGATWRDYGDFAEALAANPALRDRVLPTPRCVVAMRARRTGTELDTSGFGSNLWAMLGAFNKHSQDAYQNMLGFLLVRDGDNIYRVDSELVVEHITRLFPTEDQKAAPFRDKWDRDNEDIVVTPDKPEYYEARTEYEGTMLFYRRLLICLWGLDDRLTLFGYFYGPDDGAFMSLRMHTTRIAYVYDEETLALGDGARSFNEWWNDINHTIRIGSRVMLTQREPDSKKHIVATVGAGFTVRIQRKRQWSDTTASSILHLKGPKALASTSYIALDAVSIADLDRYIDSRVARKDYLLYLDLFMALRNILTEERRTEEQVLADVARVLGTKAPAHSVLQSALGEWKARAKTALPKKRTADYAMTVDQIARLSRKTGMAEATRASEIAAFEGKSGRTVLRVAESARPKRVCIYATAITSEKPFAEAIPFPWVVRCEGVTFEEAALAKAEIVALEDRDVGERTVYETATPKGHAAYYGPHLDAMHLVREALDHSLQGLHELWGMPFHNEVILHAYQRRLASHSQHSFQQISLDYMVPIGILQYRQSRIERIGVLVASQEILCHALTSAPNGREVVGRFLAGLPYKSKSSIITQLPPNLEVLSFQQFRATKKRSLLHGDPSRTDDNIFSIASARSNGYDLLYDFFRESGAELPRLSLSNEGWQGELADELDRLSQPQPKRKANLVWIAPGVTSWLRRAAESEAAAPRVERPIRRTAKKSRKSGRS